MINEFQQLSERERQILHLVATGRSNQQIANDLGISVNTVKVHLRNVFGKIGAASRTEATMYAVRHGIVTVDRIPLATPDAPAVSPEPTAEADIQPAPPELLPAAEEPVAPAPVLLPAAPPAEAEIELVPTVPTFAAPAAHPRRSRLMLGLVISLLALVVVLTGLLFVLQRRSAASLSASAPLNEQRWSTLPALPAARAAFAIAAADNRLFVIGGEGDGGVFDSVLRYDTQDATWVDLSRKPTPVTDVRAVTLGARLYVPGGRRSGDATDVTRVFERYDPRTESWDQLADLPEPRSGYALAAFEGKLYLFGGWDGTTYRADVFEYDPEGNTWQTRTAMPTARAFAEAAVVEGNVYVLGGENASGPIASNEEYTPSQEGSGPWQRRPPMIQARSRFGTAPVLSSIYAFGGQGAGTTALEYDVHTERWESFQTPEVIGSQAGIALLDDTIVAVGGRSDAGYSAQVQGYQALFRVRAPLPQVP